ncbi:uncharacterized protein LOC124452014 [Xenia sp. Carnegie-2017]|uniref:uncharacterized protein LOC124452014 n=1 Tax=Xenia sp. Carnegie-2017 TaxID=2897299 RepID=UPI001F0469D5|nr:uncharacterized protein LOC124452014 [Xenia sp. Carnegie-2017]
MVEKAHWWGRCWESLIRSVKRPLRKVVGRTNLSYDELHTIVVESEGVIIARPLTYVHDDEEAVFLPLSPSHLVYGRRITTMPNSEHFEIQTTYQSLTRKAKHHKNLLQRFTLQWRNEYLLALQEQYTSKSRGNQNPEIAVGDIVIIRNDQTKRIFWKVAKVEQLLQGDERITRAAQIRVLRGDFSHSHLLRRSIRQLIPIEVHQEEHSNERVESDKNGEEEQVLRPTDRPQRNAGITGQLRRLQNTNKLYTTVYS